MCLSPNVKLFYYFHFINEYIIHDAPYSVIVIKSKLSTSLRIRVSPSPILLKLAQWFSRKSVINRQTKLL